MNSFLDFRYSDSGDMVYIDEKDRSILHKDIMNFINSSDAH